jgi:iron uptake system EfeUOB component EfeO/EfeM
MFDIKMTINGKPLSETSFEEEIFKGVVETAKEGIASAITAEEASKITIDAVGTDLEDLSLNINGPEEIVAKIQEALSE